MLIVDETVLKHTASFASGMEIKSKHDKKPQIITTKEKPPHGREKFEPFKFLMRNRTD